ncbi:YihY/virulence factor BrkB family protein [Streptomyces sp. NA04227]|uniref:YihY/virulence factor BrkB family protein n=1 Tax=Streptomyces sp. NA04227 TaxID=2742136 RepID=UPI001592A700|nr:YihY/virulence factor BrkB family protein [Streptomyces sp. NA04227]QKW08758.1 YihY/virulence factor BrkB family protein [Streptomyces sp. NA04227]
MDWLKRLPVVGPHFARLMRSHPWRAYERLDEVKWSQLAAAMTFISFLALFPLLTVAAAIAAATLTEGRRENLEDKLADQVPGISDQLDISSLVDNAGTVGVIAGALLLFTGVGWVGSMRECLRTVWRLPDDAADGNLVTRKIKDTGILAGLGGAGLVSLIVSALASTTIGWTARQLGVEAGGWGGILLRIAGFAVAVLADYLLLLYVLTLLPGAHPERRPLLTAALIGALGFELLKLLLGGYISGVAGKSMYGAFGVPVALLLWINFTAKLLLYCAAWTATASTGDTENDAQDAADDDRVPGDAGDDVDTGSAPPPGGADTGSVSARGGMNTDSASTPGDAQAGPKDGGGATRV